MRSHRGSPVLGRIRGKVAIYNENVRAIAERHDCIVADQWALKVVQDARFFDDDVDAVFQGVVRDRPATDEEMLVVYRYLRNQGI